jgi:hypothetical protein
VKDAGGVGEYLESYSLMCVCVCVCFCRVHLCHIGHEEEDAASSCGGTLSQISDLNNIHSNLDT